MPFIELEIKQIIVLADKHGSKDLFEKLHKRLSYSDDYGFRTLMYVVISQTITYADNRPLFKELSEFCLANYIKTRFGHSIEFNQRIGYSQSRLKEDDMTEFLINLYSLGSVIVRNHQHFFSEEYQAFVEL